MIGIGSEDRALMIVGRFTYCCILDSVLLTEEKNLLSREYEIPIVIHSGFYEDNRTQLPKCWNR
jgi:hypothetical protein